jgi:ComF family protein
MIKEAMNKLLYAVFPRRCELCGEVVAFDKALCNDCENLKRISGDLCRICGRPKDVCDCKNKTKKPEYKAFIAPYYYEGSIRAGAVRFKEYGFPELSVRMGKEMYAHIANNYCDIPFDVITFVPMTRKKERKRGYNQSELLANEVSKHMDIPVEKLIAKIRSTSQQKRLGARQRRVNLRGSFDLENGAEVKGKTILLVDDIRTTGSTINECAYVLNCYGAKAVYAAAFCMAKPKDE